MTNPPTSNEVEEMVRRVEASLRTACRLASLSRATTSEMDMINHGIDALQSLSRQLEEARKAGSVLVAWHDGWSPLAKSQRPAEIDAALRLFRNNSGVADR